MTEFDLSKLYREYLETDRFYDAGDNYGTMTDIEIGTPHAVLYPACDVRYDLKSGAIRLVGIPKWVPCNIPAEYESVEWIGLVNNGTTFDVIFGIGNPFDGESMLPMKEDVTIAVPRAWADHPHFYYEIKTQAIKD